MADGRENKNQKDLRNMEIDWPLQAKYRNYKMDNAPLAIQQLMSSGEVELNKEYGCCKITYGVSSADAGSIMVLRRGCKKVIAKDTQGVVVVKTQLHFSYLCFMCCCNRELPYFTVQVMDAPVLVMKPKSLYSYTILIYDEEDQPVLEVWKKSGPSAEYKITNAQNKAEIGTIKKDVRDYVVQFPIDLDVRYKIALITLCAIENPLEPE